MGLLVPPPNNQQLLGGEKFPSPAWQGFFNALWAAINNLGGNLSRQILTTAPLTGGGDLTADRTIAIAANGIVNSLLAQMPANTLKGNNTGGVANAADLTVAQTLTLLGLSGGITIVITTAALTGGGTTGTMTFTNGILTAQTQAT